MREITFNNTTYLVVNDIQCEVEKVEMISCIEEKVEKTQCEVEKIRR